MRSRNERRRLRRQVGDLSDDARRVRRELFACDAHLADLGNLSGVSGETQTVTATLRVDVLRGIEAYVDALGKLVDVDDKMTSFAFEDDEPFHELLVRHRWLGAETVERAKHVLEDEVARRSVGKSDLALLLSSVDQVAFQLYGTRPKGAIDDLHGEAAVNEIVDCLTAEEFARTLLSDPRWAEMRRRWVRLGWRMTTEETFNAAFIRAAAERVVEIHEGAVRDTIRNEQLQKESLAIRDQMIEAFRLRLEREYDALPRRSGKECAVDITLPAEDVKMLDVIADRWDTTRGGAMDRIVREAVQEHAPAPVQPDVVVGAQSGSPGFVSDGDWWNDAIPYSDHELMRRGRVLWEGSYAQGMTDEQVRSDVVRSDAGFPAELVHFSAKWAVHAFQRLMTSHTFAAALMCSDVQRDVLVGIEKQWDAFLVIVPNGMLVADRFEFTRVWSPSTTSAPGCCS